MCKPVQFGGVEVHWPGFAHSMLSAPVISWPSSQLNMQTIPSGWGVPAETGDDRERLQLIWALDGISGAGHPIAENKDYEMS